MLPIVAHASLLSLVIPGMTPVVRSRFGLRLPSASRHLFPHRFNIHSKIVGQKVGGSQVTGTLLRAQRTRDLLDR
jgi:hypothetical protein